MWVLHCEREGASEEDAQTGRCVGNMLSGAAQRKTVKVEDCNHRNGEKSKYYEGKQ